METRNGKRKNGIRIKANDSPKKSNASKVTNERRFVCKICGFAFKYQGNLRDHIHFYHMKGAIPCNECSKFFPTYSELRKHRTQHSVQKGRCPHCRSNITNKWTPREFRKKYSRHLKTCNRKPISRSDFILTPKLIDDAFKESEVEPVETIIPKCRLCSLTFNCLDAYTIHIKDLICIEKSPRNESSSSEIGSNSLSESSDDTSDESVQDIPTITCMSSKTNEHCMYCGDVFEDAEILQEHLINEHQETVNPQRICIPSAPNVLYTYTSTENHKKIDPNLNGSQYFKENEACLSKKGRKEPGEIVCFWFCKDCKQGFHSEKLLIEHKDSCSYSANENEEVQSQLINYPNCNLDSASSAETKSISVQWHCKECKIMFTDISVWKMHLKACFKNGTTRISFSQKILIDNLEVFNISHDIGAVYYWVCKYCKSHYPNQKTMRIHKTSCSLNVKCEHS